MDTSSSQPPLLVNVTRRGVASWRDRGSGGLPGAAVRCLSKTEGLEGVRYVEVNLARLSEDEFRAELAGCVSGDGPSLVLIDEVDAKPDSSWPYEVLLPFLDVNLERSGHVVFVMAGSAGASMDEMKQAIGSRPKAPIF